MWLVFLVLILALGILYSKLELNLQHVHISQEDWNFKAFLEVKFFGFFKIFSLKLNKKYMQFWGFKIQYTKLVSKEEMKKMNKKTFECFQKFQIEFDQIYFRLKVWMINIPITNLFVVLFSSIFPSIIRDRVKRKNLKYHVDCWRLPNSSEELLRIELNGKIKLSIKLITFIKLYFKNRIQKFEHTKNKNYGVKESL